MKILVPTDFSENAENAYFFARKLAHLHNASITLLFAFYAVYDFAVQPADVESIENEATDELKKAVEKGHLEGLKVDSKIIQGTIATSVTATAYREDYDLIVMGTQGASGMKKALIGSNTGHVIKESKVPVLVVPESAQWEILSKISLAISLENDEQSYFDFLIGLTAKMNLPYELIHFEKSAEFQKEIKWKGMINYLSEKLPDQEVSSLKESSDSYEESLQNYLDKNGDTLMVMFYKDKTFFEYLFNKSQTLQMAYHTHVPLLVIK